MTFSRIKFFVATLLITNLSFASIKPLSDKKRIAIAVTAATITTATQVIIGCKLEPSSGDFALAFAPLTGLLTGLVLAEILSPLTPSGKFAKASKMLDLLEIDHILIRNYNSFEDVIAQINQSFHGPQAIIESYEYLNNLLKTATSLEKTLRKNYIKMAASGYASSWGSDKYKIEKAVKLEEKIRHLIDTIEKHPDFLTQKTLSEINQTEKLETDLKSRSNLIIDQI